MSAAPQQQKPKAPKTAITPTRAEDYAEWYQKVVRAADMAELSGVRGCMIIKPWGYGSWELMQRDLDARIKKPGIITVICPFLIPRVEVTLHQFPRTIPPGLMIMQPRTPDSSAISAARTTF